MDQDFQAMSAETADSFASNPFFIPYERTDLKLWQQMNRTVPQVKKQLLKRRIMRKPILNHLLGHTGPKATDWLKLDLREIDAELSWVRSFGFTKRFEHDSLYDMTDLIIECEGIKCSLLKNMSEMAKMMYS